MRYKIRVKRINQVFRQESDYDARLARVAVLYEDLRLENLAASAKSIEALDASGVDVRRFYFIRRSIATSDHFRLMFRLALAGFGHAGRCAQTLAVYDLWPRFNGILP